MKDMTTDSIPKEILSKDDLPKISEKHNFIAGIRIGKKLFYLLEFREFTEKKEIKIINTPSFICYDKERNDENIGKPLSKKDFDDCSRFS